MGEGGALATRIWIMRWHDNYDTVTCPGKVVGADWESPAYSDPG